MDSSSPALLLILKQWILIVSRESICTWPLNSFKNTKWIILIFEVHCQWPLLEAHVEKSRHAGRDGGHGGAAGDCAFDGAAGGRRMALVRVTWAGLQIVHFLASAISSGKNIFAWGSEEAKNVAVSILDPDRAGWMKKWHWMSVMVQLWLVLMDGTGWDWVFV